MSQSATLKATVRDKVGSRSARKLRRDGQIPASLQTDGNKPHIDLSMDRDEFLTTRRQHVHLYDLDFDGDLQSAVVRELQWDAFGDQIIHVEFKRVQRGVETEAEVELEFVGHPKGGIVTHLVTHVTVLTIPSKIPDSLEVRVTDLEEGAHIMASDLEMPEGVKLAIPADTEIAVVSTQRVEVEPTEEGEEIEGGEGAAPAGEPPATPDDDA